MERLISLDLHYRTAPSPTGEGDGGWGQL